MASPASFLTTNKSIVKTLPNDPQTDFAPVTKLADQSMALVVKGRQKCPIAAAVLTAAKSKSEGLTYASSGDGSPQHLAALMFESHIKGEQRSPLIPMCPPCARAASTTWSW